MAKQQTLPFGPPKKTAPGRRSLKLIAEFNDIGFAIGWKMTVWKCFRDALDIKYTSRKENGKTVKRWTQGKAYSFSAGDIIYDTPRTHLESCKYWANAIWDIDQAFQIIEAQPAELKEENGEKILTPGFVKFEILTKNADQTTLDRKDVAGCTQAEFIEILKTGEIKDQFYIFKKDN